MDGGPGGSGGGFDEEDEWDIRDFTDPRTQETYPIIDGRVIIAFKNPPVFPEMDPNYFDIERDLNDCYYQLLSYVQVLQNQDVAGFVQTENLYIYAEWDCVKGLGATLPLGTTVEYAVSQWPQQYPDLIESVDPDRTVDIDIWPYTNPNDSQFANQWAINDSSGASINIHNAWRASYYGSSSEVVAVLDTGVQLGYSDLIANRTTHGVNTGDKSSSTTYLQNGGAPWSWLLDWNPYCAHDLGHGTFVAGIISAGINNDSPPSQQTAVCGISHRNRYLPVAIKAFSNGYGTAVFSSSATLNAYDAIGKIKGVYPSSNTPYYNIEVANCSYSIFNPNMSSKYILLESRFINHLSQYILFVCCAGNNNSSSSWNYPAAYANTMAVTGYNDEKKRSSNQNYNPQWVNIAAPGTDILSTDMIGLSPVKHFQLGYTSGNWSSESGTSFAAPHVSAIAALLSSRYPSLTPHQIRIRIVERGTQDLQEEISFLRRLNARLALD